MLKTEKIISLVLILFSISAANIANAKWTSTMKEVAIAAQVEEKLQSMTLFEKVGQLFIFGFKGKNYDGRLSAIIRDTNPGGVIVFSRNIETARQIQRLNQSLQQASVKYSGTPLLIALDQEGGEVTRIKLNPPLPSALAIGKTSDETLSERMGYLTGKILKSLGFNMNLAPVLDLSDPEMGSFIGTRSFGGDPQEVSQMTAAYASGLDAADVISTGKHFPGHGNIAVDSHKKLPIKNTNLAELMTSDLMPFNLFMRQVRAPAIMVAHVSYPKIDPSLDPATFSKPILDGILRKQLKYNGLVVTDDIEMAAAKAVGGFETRAIKAINAGADLIMVGWSRKAQRSVYDAVVTAVKNNKISRKTLDSAVRRILTSKARYVSLNKAPKSTLKTFTKVIKSKYIKDVTDTILEKNFFKGLHKLSEDSFVFTDQPVVVVSGKREFFNNFKKYSKTKALWAPFRRNTQQLVSKLEKVKNSKILFYVTGPISARTANSLPYEIRKRTFILNATTPGLIKDPASFIGSINIYSPHPKAGKLMAENVIRKTEFMRTIATEASSKESL